MKKRFLLFAMLFIGCTGDDSSENNNTPNMCQDESIIDLEVVCTTQYEPVCGCDGVTYSNSCEAFNIYGIIAYSEGACN